LFQQVCVGIFSAIAMVVGLMGMMSKSSKQKRIVGKEKDSQQQEEVAKKIIEHNKKVLPIAKLPSLQLSAFRHFFLFAGCGVAERRSHRALTKIGSHS